MKQPPSKIAGDTLFIQPRNWFAPLRWTDWFGTTQPLAVDLGAGDGGFIIQRAISHPQINHVAVERLLGRARKIDRKAMRAGLANLRILRIDTMYALRCLFPPHSLSTVTLLFPDPWPKKRHHHRRIIRGDFIALVEAALEPGGLFCAATDHVEYFSEMVGAFSKRPAWSAEVVGPERWFPEKTDFEAQFESESRSIGRLSARHGNCLESSAANLNT